MTKEIVHSETIMIRIIDNQESWSMKLAKNLFGMVMLVAVLWGPGLLLDSAAMQWAGFFAFWALALLSFNLWQKSGMTIAQARKRLDLIEAEHRSEKRT